MPEVRFPKLRFVASVGEPLNPEAVWVGQGSPGLPIHDNWWQTETGEIMIANTTAVRHQARLHGAPVAGSTRPSFSATGTAVSAKSKPPTSKANWRSRGDGPRCSAATSTTKNAIASASPARNQEWYLTGDLAKRDADGYFWFVGRADDVIKSAGHLIGPGRSGSALMEHPAVAEAGVIGKPDPVVGEVVKAFVSLKRVLRRAKRLRMELLSHARKRLGAAVAPKEIAFMAQLPRTRSGKIMRRLPRLP